MNKRLIPFLLYGWIIIVSILYLLQFEPLVSSIFKKILPDDLLIEFIGLK